VYNEIVRTPFNRYNVYAVINGLFPEEESQTQEMQGNSLAKIRSDVATLVNRIAAAVDEG
jgi:hypothetical protein